MSFFPNAPVTSLFSRILCKFFFIFAIINNNFKKSERVIQMQTVRLYTFRLFKIDISFSKFSEVIFNLFKNFAYKIYDFLIFFALYIENVCYAWLSKLSKYVSWVYYFSKCIQKKSEKKRYLEKSKIANVADRNMTYFLSKFSFTSQIIFRNNKNV